MNNLKAIKRPVDRTPEIQSRLVHQMKNKFKINF